jgi:hypothetical protein
LRLPSHAGRALVAAALLAGFLALLYTLDQHGLDPSPLRMAHAPILVIYGVVVIASLVCAFAPAHWRRTILLVATGIAAPLALGAWAIAWFAWAAWVIAVVRAPVRLVVRLAAAAAAWVVLPVARDLWLDGAAQADTMMLATVWVGQLYAALYLAIERERERPALRSTIGSDAFYLLAPPRLIAPFFQPISPRLVVRAERRELPVALLWRAAALAACAALAAVLASLLSRVARQVDYGPLVFAIRFCHFYARITYAIFTAIAIFRLLGFNLPSGFRRPFLSRSFAEFFRRYNHYVRDAVVSLFYFPLLGRLRHALRPRAATIISAYLAIVAGSFLLHDLLVPMSLTIEPRSVIGYYVDPVRLVGLFGYWTLIIIPTAGIAPRPAPPRSRLRTILDIAAFNAAYLALWYAQEVGRGHR